MQETAADVYSIPQEHLDFCATIGQIAREKIAPRSAEIDENAEYPWDIRRLLAEQDVLGLPFPTEYGGTGTGTLMLNMAVEELAKVDAAVALILMVQELGTLPIQLFGSEEQKERFLPRCASGEWSPAFALSEPEAGSDPAGMQTTAVWDGPGGAGGSKSGAGGSKSGAGGSRSGAGEWVINGTKNWISNLGIADFYVTFAVTDRESKRITAFIVEADRPGFSVGKLEHKLGIRASPTGQPIFEEVRVPQENVLGEVGRGLRVALGTLERTRLGAAAQAVGIAQGRPTTPSPTRVSASSSASLSAISRASSSSSPTWKSARPPPASCSTRPVRWPTRNIRNEPSTPRWPRFSARTPPWRSRLMRFRCWVATVMSRSTPWSA
jgi:alkylation response protein AidB-like acyl-CoA dehydrogenase